MEEVIWKKLDGLDDYEFGHTGIIKSHPKRANHYKTVITQGSKSSNGYWVFMIRRPGFKRQEKVHRLIARAHIPNPLNLPYINHKDANRLNNHISNLEWCTDLQNKRHAFENGLVPKGEDVGLAKLTESQVREIFNSNKKQKELAKIYGVDQVTISSIKIRKTWRHITNEIEKGVYEKNRVYSKELILAVFNSNLRKCDISKKFNIGDKVVNSIKTGFRYSNITGKKYIPQKKTNG